MAGNYPDVPAPRMAYDRDGSRLLYTHISSSIIVAEYGPQSAHITSMADESAPNFKVGTWGVATVGVTTIFPQTRTVAAYTFIRAYTYNGNWGNFQYSQDTTNGIDGIWTTVEANQTITYSKELMRTGIRTITPIDAIAVRWTPYTGTGGGNAEMWYHGYHLYGSIATGASPDRLRLWHPTLDEPLDDPNAADGAYLDWGNVPRGTSQDRIFRIKNNSATLTANSIAVAAEVPTDTTPAVAAQMTFSDGGAFATSINIGNLTPGGLSPVITMRRTTPTNAALSLWSGRVNAIPGSWS